MRTRGELIPDEISAIAEGKPNFPPYLRHELLTQVNAIIGYSEMLLEEIADRGGSTKGWHADLDKIRASGADLFLFLENSRTDPGSSEFLTDLLYFIRTLVTTIVGYADLLLEEADKQTLPATLHDLEIIRNAGHTLVARLQAFVQLDETQASLANLGSAIAEVFPLMRNAVTAMQSRKNKSTRLLPGKLLVVDDDAISRELLVHELQREGYQVDVAEGGRQALAMIRCDSYDLLILDIVMPEMNGYQVLEQLKSDGTLIDLPVVIISAWIEMDDIAHCIELGAEDYLPRKFNSALLKARVSASLEKKWLREQRQAWLQEKQKVEHAALLASEKKFRQLVSGALVGIFRTTPEGRVLDANPVMLQTLGYASITELNQAGMQNIYADPSDQQRLLALLRQSPVRGFETRGRRKSGGIFYAALSAQLVSSEDGSEQFLEGTLEDITERKQAEMELRIAATVFESQEGMMVTDARKVILRVNKSFSQVTGYTAEEAVGQTPNLLNSGRQDKAFYAAMWEHIKHAGAWEGEIWNRRKNGDIYPEYLTVTAVKDAAGIVTNYVATFNDITVSKAAEDEIKNLAFYDPLTHLPNRRLLCDRLKLALASSMRSGREGALLFLDLDYFKNLNDTLGHGMGDLLLQQVAQRLSTCVREGDTVARLGGDEFVVMLEDLSERRTEAAEQVRVVGEKIISTLNQPYQLAGHEYRNTPSIGATLFNDCKAGIDELLRQADIALYQAKGAGRNTLRFFKARMQEEDNVHAVIEDEPHAAIDKRQL